MGYGANGRGGAVSHEMILERVHTNLYSIVGEAVDDVKGDEEKWSPSEMVKRISGYIYKAARAPELLEKPWQEMAVALVNSAMGSYMSACGERSWFYQLGLGHAFTSAVWELMQARGRPRVHFKDVQDFVMQEFESHLDKSLLTKAMWDAISSTFSDEIIRGKVYKAVYNSYHTVLDELLEDSRPIPEAKKVERFTKRWVEASMQRAWSSVENSEAVLTTGMVTRLFQNLIAPFGEGHEYSCIPIMFIETIGRPPRNWKFLKQTVLEMFKHWKEGQSHAPPPKRRKKMDVFADADTLPLPEDEEAPADEVDPATFTEDNGMGAKEEVDADDTENIAEPEDSEVKDEIGESEGGHPECTSEEDCIGKPSDNLVRHMLEGDAGDVYCQTCWESFLSQNANLSGMWEDGDLAGQIYEQQA
eukprot:TRINITY_DN2266_c0_g1_i1.p1 TRINITY_DN2266_c0_g1~~TRINITY_DN2266_c0_g1_i1.p1  ORF type:complete len:417 (-),score=110.36 TRINITY_DN2266_c0_g1_i1:89-1339(-)